MEVFVVVYLDRRDGEAEVCGVFSSRELAEKVAQECAGREDWASRGVHVSVVVVDQVVKIDL